MFYRFVSTAPMQTYTSVWLQTTLILQLCYSLPFPSLLFVARKGGRWSKGTQDHNMVCL